MNWRQVKVHEKNLLTARKLEANQNEQLCSSFRADKFSRVYSFSLNNALFDIQLKERKAYRRCQQNMSCSLYTYHIVFNVIAIHVVIAYVS